MKWKTFPKVKVLIKKVQRSTRSTWQRSTQEANMDIKDLQHLAGIRNKFTGYTPYVPENMSITGTEKAQIQRKKKIQPGTEEWFKLWFSQPHLTGEKPT